MVASGALSGELRLGVAPTLLSSTPLIISQTIDANLIHPESLALINYFGRQYDMVQVPVLALPTPWLTPVLVASAVTVVIAGAVTFGAVRARIASHASTSAPAMVAGTSQRGTTRSAPSPACGSRRSRSGVRCATPAAVPMRSLGR